MARSPQISLAMSRSSFCLFITTGSEERLSVTSCVQFQCVKKRKSLEHQKNRSQNRHARVISLELLDLNSQNSSVVAYCLLKNAFATYSQNFQANKQN